MPSLSRRDFVLAAGATPLLIPRPGSARQGLTAQAVIDRLRSEAGVPWGNSTVDTFKAGNPLTVVTGIATTAMATVDVLRTAAGRSANLIITQEPTFYAPNDLPGPRAADPVFLAKKALIDEQRLVIWRFSDHWNARRPNPAAMALARALGWTDATTMDGGAIARGLDTTLGALAADVRQRLGVRGGLRTVGRPEMRVDAVYLSPGTTTVPDAIAHLAHADVILAGEPREWEAVPYVVDTWSAGAPKGMLVLGRIVSEAPGMRACAAWVQSLVPEVPVTWIDVADPYWSPVP